MNAPALSRIAGRPDLSNMEMANAIRFLAIDAVEKSLGELKVSASEDRNLVPPILAAVESSATLGEIVGALKTVWGEHRPGA